MDLVSVSLHPEDQLFSLYQGGCSLEHYVEDFIELCHQVHWNEVMLKTFEVGEMITSAN